jgi:hypothetical protein
MHLWSDYDHEPGLLDVPLEDDEMDQVGRLPPISGFFQPFIVGSHIVKSSQEEDLGEGSYSKRVGAFWIRHSSHLRSRREYGYG